MLIKKKAKEGYKHTYYHYIRGKTFIEIEIIDGKNKGVVTRSNSSTWSLGYISTWSLNQMKEGRLIKQNNF